jgi:hypothetical protein
MNAAVAWLIAHYVTFGQYILGAAGTVLLAVIGNAAQRPGAVSWWIDRTALWIAGVALLLTAAVAGTKLWKPGITHDMSWTVPGLSFAIGLLLLVARFLVARQKRSKLGTRLRPLIDALSRSLTQSEQLASWNSERYVDLCTIDGAEVTAQLSWHRGASGVQLLSGPMGSGKTVAMLRIARRYVDALRNAHDLVLPVYVDLATVPAVDRQKGVVDLVRNSVLAEPNAGDLFEQELVNQRSRVRWLFLFDNLDQWLGQQSGSVSDARADWVNGLSEFVKSDLRHRQAVIAGRVTPSCPAARRVRIAPLKGRLQRTFLRASGLGSAQAATLSVDPRLEIYATNPGWISLVAPYLANDRARLPRSVHELISNVVAARLGPQPNHECLLISAELLATALTLKLNPDDGISGEDAEELLHGADSTSACDGKAIMETLQQTGLGRLRLQSEGRLSFTFQHDIVRSYLMTRQLLEGKVNATPTELLVDPRWTGAAEAILQMGPADVVAPLLMEASKLLRDADRPLAEPDPPVQQLLAMLAGEDKIADKPVPFAGWSDRAQHVLRLLSAGLYRRRDLLPDDLQYQIDELVARACTFGTWQAHARALEAVPIANVRVAAGAVARALRSASGWLVELGINQIVLRAELFQELPARDRLRFLVAVSLGAAKTRTALMPTHPLEETMRMASSVSRITAALVWLLFGLPLVVGLFGPGDALSVAILLVGLIVVTLTVAASVYGIADGSVRRGLLANGARVVIGTLGAMVVLALFILISAFWDVATGAGIPANSLLTMAAIAWPLSALWYLVLNRSPERRDFYFPFPAVVEPAIATGRALFLRVKQVYNTSRENLSKSLIGWTCVVLIVLALLLAGRGIRLPAIDSMNSHVVTDVTAGIVGTAAACCLIVWWVLDRIRDRRWLRAWRPHGEPVDSGRVLSWLGALRTDKGTVDLLTALPARLPADEAIEAAAVFTDLYDALEWVHRLRRPEGQQALASTIWETAPRFATKDFRKWLQDYDQKHTGRLHQLSRDGREVLVQYLISIDQVPRPAHSVDG